MKRNFGAVALVAFGLLLASVVEQRVAHAVRPASTFQATPTIVTSLPMAPKHPLKITLAGAAQGCVTFSPAGQAISLTCTVDCSFDVATSFPDGGFSQLAGADSNPLAAATPYGMYLPDGIDSVCVYSATAGSAYVAGRYP